MMWNASILCRLTVLLSLIVSTNAESSTAQINLVSQLKVIPTFMKDLTVTIRYRRDPNNGMKSTIRNSEGSVRELYRLCDEFHNFYATERERLLPKGLPDEENEKRIKLKQKQTPRNQANWDDLKNKFFEKGSETTIGEAAEICFGFLEASRPFFHEWHRYFDAVLREIYLDVEKTNWTK